MNMIEVKTAERSGAALDWAVGSSAGGEQKPHQFADNIDAPFWDAWVFPDGYACTAWNPSGNWNQGGQLIAKHLITVGTEASTEDGSVYFWAYAEAAYAGMPVVFGETHLIAACRAIVAAKLGDTVQIPAELLP